VVWFVALRPSGDLSKGGSAGREESAAPQVVPEAPKSPERPVKPEEKEPVPVSTPPQANAPPPEDKAATAGENKPGIADHLRIGSFYLDRGQYEEAVAQFEAAKALAPNDQAVLTSLARAQKALEAESRIRRAR